MRGLLVFCFLTLTLSYEYKSSRFVLKYPSNYEDDDSELRHALIRQYHHTSSQTKRNAPPYRYEIKHNDGNNKLLFYNRNSAPSSHYETIKSHFRPRPLEHMEDSRYSAEDVYSYSKETEDSSHSYQNANDETTEDDEVKQRSDEQSSSQTYESQGFPKYRFAILQNVTSYCRNLNRKNGFITFPDDEDSRFYFMCTDKTTAVRMPCPPFTVFNPLTNSCVTSDEIKSRCKGCMNGGECVMTNEGYACKCSYNYKGEHCEEHIPRCDPNPCQNGGRCYEISTPPGYICECPNKIFDTCCCHGIENKCAHVPRRFYGEKGRMFIHCSKDGYAFVKFCPPNMTFNDYRQTCTYKTKRPKEDTGIPNPEFYQQTENREYYDIERKHIEHPYIFNQSTPEIFY